MPSKIAWTDETWPVVTGCTKVSEGCTHCYAERLAHRWGRSFDVTLHPERLDQPLHWRRPRRVFVCATSDLFHPDVPDTFHNLVFQVFEDCPQHQFQVLTKRPERMRRYLEVWKSPFLAPYPNVHLGVTIESAAHIDRADYLRDTPAAVRWISAEPLLGPLVERCDHCVGTGRIVYFAGWSVGGEPCPYCQARGWNGLDLTGIDWLVIGGESGPNRRPMELQWLTDLVAAADAAGTKVWVKQDNAATPGKQGRIPDGVWQRKEWP